MIVKLMIAVAISLVPAQLLMSQVLETEESHPLLPGQVEIGTGLEIQTSKEGHEIALPFAFEYGLSKRFTFLLEPVSFTGIHPKRGASHTGIGDIEVTLFYQLLKEKVNFPAISISAEVKLPTAKDRLIGTGKTDFTPYVIASKTTGKFFSSLNLSYTFLGKPKGSNAGNLFNYAIGTIFHFVERSILFGEVYGNTSAFGKEVPEGAIIDPAINTEISGGEVVGAFGYGYYLRPELLVSFGVSFDNNKAVLFRPGIEWKFGGRPMK
jgi:hypothetical protein